MIGHRRRGPRYNRAHDAETGLRGRRVSRRAVALFFLSIAIVYYSALGTIPLLEPDEGRYAEIPREMLAKGDFVTPRLNGVAYLEKPPLFYWGNALSMAVLGETEFAARFFTATVSIGGVLLTWWMGASLAGWRTGLFSAMVLSTCLYHYFVGRLNTIDMTLAVTMVLAVFPAYLYLSGKRERRRYLHLSYAGAALAFLAKGLIGIVFPAAILLLWILLSRRHRDIGKAISLPGIVLFLAIALPWVILVQRANPDFLWFFFVQEHFLRYATKMHSRYQPFWFFLPIVVGGLLPWLAFGRRAAMAIRASAAGYFAAEDRRFLLCWVFFVLLFFSFSKSKLITYVAPLFPPLAVLFGRALDLWADREDGRVRCRFPLALAAVMAAGILAFPPFTRYPIEAGRWALLCALPVALILAWGVVPLFVRRLGAEKVVCLSWLLLALFLTSLNRPEAEYIGRYKSVKGLSAVLNASLQEGDVVAQYNTYRQGIPFYTKRRSVQVNEIGELQFGADRAPDRDRYFLDDKAFLDLWNSGDRVFCVLRGNMLPVAREKFPGHRLLYHTDEGILIVNRL